MKLRRTKNESGSMALRIFLSLALLMTFRTFQFFPGMQYLQEAWFALCLLATVTIYPIWKIRRGLRLSYFELYLLIVIPVAVVLPAWEAQREFGQPLLYGLLSQRFLALVASLLLLLNGLHYRLVRIADLEAALLIAAWGTSVLYLAMQIFLNPANFVGAGTSFVLVVNGQAAFKLPTEFIVYGVLYYVLRGVRTKTAKYYLAAALLFAGTMGGAGNGRMAMISLVLSLGFFVYRWLPMRQFLVITVKFCFIAIVVIGIAYVTSPTFLTQRTAAFSDAFRVTVSASEVDNPSANVRLLEVLTAIPYIEKNPLLGNGSLSAQWQGGVQGALGAFFFPADIGLVGGVFVFGVFGTILMGCQYWFALLAAQRVPSSLMSPLADAAKAFLLYSAISSFSVCYFVFFPERTLFFVTLLFGIAFQMPDLLGTSKEMALCGPQEPVLSA